MAGIIREVEATEDDEEMMDAVKEDAHLIEPATGVTKERFLMLFILAMNMIFGGIMFTTLSPVNNIASVYYAVTPVQVEWLSNIVTICNFAALPASSLVAKFGVRNIVMIAVLLNFFSASLQYPGYRKDLFVLVMLSRVSYGIAWSILQMLPAKISAVWFAKDERATATGVGCMSAAVGVTIGNLLAGYMIREGDARVIEGELKKFYTIQLILASLLFLLVFFFKEKPIVPPSLSCERETVDFLQSMKILLGSKNSLIMVHSSVMLGCVSGTSGVLFNPLITSTFREGYEQYIGLMGAISCILGVFSILVTGILADKYQRYKLLSIVVSSLTAVSWLCTFVVLTNTKNFPAVFALSLVFGLFLPDYAVLFIEGAAETFYPVSEEKIAMISLVVATPYSCSC